MLAYLKWLFTPKSARPAYVLKWFNKNVAVHPKIYYNRLFDKSNFNLTDFDYRSSIFDKVSLCPAGVLPLMEATERDIRAQGRYKDELALKADLEKYYNYIIREFAKRLKGATPLAREPYMDVKTFEEWRLAQDLIEKADAEEEMLSKTCKKVLDDIRGYKNMGGGASCAAS